MVRVNVEQSMVMMSEGEDRKVYNVKIQGKWIEQVQEIKYVRCIANDRDTEKVEFKNKIINERRAAEAIKKLVN